MKVNASTALGPALIGVDPIDGDEASGPLNRCTLCGIELLFVYVSVTCAPTATDKSCVSNEMPLP